MESDVNIGLNSARAETLDSLRPQGQTEFPSSVKQTSGNMKSQSTSLDNNEMMLKIRSPQNALASTQHYNEEHYNEEHYSEEHYNEEHYNADEGDGAC